MKYELKITLPAYKILYSVLFMVIIILVRPISSFSEIITAIEPNVALLAGVFMADNYYKEYTGERIAVYYRYPIRKKYVSMLIRIKRNRISHVRFVFLIWKMPIFIICMREKMHERKESQNKNPLDKFVLSE